MQWCLAGICANYKNTFKKIHKNQRKVCLLLHFINRIQGKEKNTNVVPNVTTNLLFNECMWCSIANIDRLSSNIWSMVVNTKQQEPGTEVIQIFWRYILMWRCFHAHRISYKPLLTNATFKNNTMKISLSWF